VEDFDHNSIIFVFMLCSAVSIALALLSGWHILLILKGETSIELHINRRNKVDYRKIGKVFETLNITPFAANGDMVQYKNSHTVLGGTFH